MQGWFFVCFCFCIFAFGLSGPAPGSDWLPAASHAPFPTSALGLPEATMGAVKHKLTLAAAGSVGTPRRGCAPPDPGEGAGHSKGAQPDPGLRLPAPMPLSSLAARPGTMPWPLAGSSAGLGTASAVRALQPAAGPGPRPLVVPTPSAKPC